ncbi:multicopper oxidase domain-containing protein [Streptomyces sp. 7-21]|uniref:multicopper oxidase domain-containing protein n=1 Tax=Streptomyces sp. 7-21 TaxID=2802283 RepID=UPI00191D7070|nr:multicopper oxidase domain-containing protein [Streptomyces sp. 7-21]MBL1067461.1 multicopper oxidase domain-containing protein [Streptomyces sp. 7-21]
MPGKDDAHGLTPFRDPLRIPRVLRPGRGGTREDITIELEPAWERLHSELPPSLLWTYGGHFPGPTIEVRRGQRIRVAWTNRLEGAYPVAAGTEPLGDGAPPTAVPGRQDGFEEIKEVAGLPGWTVTHLHGAVTGGGHDGWAENAVSAGETQLTEYPNDQRAATLWYHDHAMHITRWNVYAGLAGMYLIRDDEERALRLPGGAYEIPLLLSDRNFETDAQGRVTGETLHKVPRLPDPDPETGEPVTIPFTGPFTLVNGVIWPYLDVEPRWCRFRMLNAANSRIFRLALIDEDGQLVRGAVKQIGSDGGLLPAPVAVDFDGELPLLTVAPAERMDLLVDFSRLRGRRLRLVNVPDAGAVPGQPAPDQDVPFPQVMEFRVDSRPVRDRFTLPHVLARSFRRLTHDIPHGHRLVVLTPPGTVGGKGHPEIWEMTEVPADSVTVPSDGVLQVTGAEGTTRTYRRTARTFDDALGFKVVRGDYEQWSFLNLGGPEHPMHIHLTSFQVLSRERYTTAGFDPAAGGTTEPVTADASPGAEVPLPPNEQGWKDVVIVPPGEMVSVLGPYEGAEGRFMYHCHLLEHEDMGMMRVFTVTPPEVAVFDHNAGHGTGHG